MKRITQLAALLVAGIVLTVASHAEDKPAQLPAACVCLGSGEAASPDITAEFRGKTVYFCCPGCKGAFEKNPDRFTAKANHQLFVTGQLVQTACPLTGKAVNPDIAVAAAGVDVGLCCNNCKAKATAANNVVELLFASTDKGFTLQTACPVSGRKIDTASSTDHNGQAVYFCCNNCKAAFEKDPAKFADKLSTP